MMSGWSALDSTGHTDIDAQHEGVHRLHDAAVEAVRARDAARIRRALHELQTASREHFENEGDLMAESAYPARTVHEAEHASFLHDLAQLVGKADREPDSPVIPLWLESRSAAWWRQHVRTSDVLLARHLAAAAALAV